MKTALYYFGLAIVALWLFIMHSAFAYSLNPIFLANEFFKDLFVLQNGYDLKRYFPYVFGLVFAIAIAAIMAIMAKKDKHFWKFAITVATLELVGIGMLCLPDHGRRWVILSAIYYGVYSFFVIVFYFYVKPDAKPKQHKPKDVQKMQKPVQNDLMNDIVKNVQLRDSYVMDRLNEGKTPKEIRVLTGLKPYQITRIKKKFESK